MSNLSVEKLLQEIEDILETSTTFPLSGGKVLVDTEKIHEVIADIRDALPNEIQEARSIAKNRNGILQDAKSEAEEIVAMADQRRKKMVAEHEITQKANAQAEDILAGANAKAQEVRRAANDYIESQLQRVDEYLTSNLANFKDARKNIRNSQQDGKR